MQEIEERVRDYEAHRFAVEAPDGFDQITISVNRYSTGALTLVDNNSPFEQLTNLMKQESRRFDFEYRSQVYSDGRGTLMVYFLLDKNHSNRGRADIDLFEDDAIRTAESVLGKEVQADKIPNRGLVFTIHQPHNASQREN